MGQASRSRTWIDRLGSILKKTGVANILDMVKEKRYQNDQNG